MLNIVVINSDNKYMEYEWDSKEEFIKDIERENENIPMLDTRWKFTSMVEKYRLYFKELKLKRREHYGKFD